MKYADIWFEMKVWETYIGLGLFVLVTIFYLVKILWILFGKKGKK